MSHEGDKAMCNESQWPEDKADWPQTTNVVQGGVVSAKPVQSYGKTRQVTVEQLVILQERCDELLKQRDELLAALEAVQAVANESSGIAGWHLNGDVASWDDLLPEVAEAIERSALDAKKGGAE